MNLRSIGVRLTLWYAAAFAVAMLVLGGAVWLAVQQGLYHAIDESLRDRADGIRIFVEDHKTRLFLDEVKEEFRAHGDLFQVMDDHGTPIHQAEALRGQVTPTVSGLTAEPRFNDGVVGGVPVRFLSTNIDVDGRVYTVQIGAPLRDLKSGLQDASWLLAPLFPALLLLAAAGGYWLSRRALAPVSEITETARSITADSLAKRLIVPATGDELQRLSETLNEMIARLESAFQKISRFTADASHELRTPLAVMRTTAEVALRADRPNGEHREALGQIVAEIQRTSGLVENMLLIANADSGHGRFRMAPVDLAAAVEEAGLEAAVLAREKGVQLDVQLPVRPVWVRGDANALRRLFLILIDNAVKYTPSGGCCDVYFAERRGLAIGAVRDTGMGICPEDLPHIFDRFYRVDRARSRQQGGTGLGLAIGQWIAASHGGTIHVESELDRGTVFEVRLPLVEEERWPDSDRGDGFATEIRL
jgi:two-component system, OmpR family, heavy metal sensor histidine kinase CusS